MLMHTGFNVGRDQIPRIVDGKGVHFVLADGRRVIDASNTGGPLGHGHPAMVEAIHRAGSAPVVNDGWLWVEREEAARDLIEIAFEGENDWVGAVRFCLSGGEANDMALSLCQALTGRSLLATRERAYHGLTGLSRDVTVQPHWHGGIANEGRTRPVPRVVPVRTIPSAGGARIGEDEPIPALDDEWTASVTKALADAAAIVLDYSQGGIYQSSSYQELVAAAARDAGALWIADEVVTGLGRFGQWFAFQGATSRPDIVTLGKPLAGGATPGGAVVLSSQIVEEISDGSWQTYSTFRGHPLTTAAVRAYLRVVVNDDLIARTSQLDSIMYESLKEIAARHPSIRRIDGRGLHWTIEFYGADWRTWYADTSKPPLASRVTGRALEAGALIGTSAEQTSLFLAPPLVISDADLHLLLEILDSSLEIADADLV